MRINNSKVNHVESKDGFLLFYVMGTVALLTVFAFISSASASLEARSAKNKVLEAQAMAHAEAGIQMVETQVEAGLQLGQDLETTLSGLSVSPPSGVNFDTISSFTIVVPGQIFQFTSVGRSGEGEVALTVQLRRKNLFQSGVFGYEGITSQPNVNIYGYNSDTTSVPTPFTSNGLASVGSDYDFDLGNSFTLDGALAVGSDEDGNVASCSGCYGIDSGEVGYMDPDPFGINNGGELSQTFDTVRVTNDNASNPAITGTVFATRPNETVTFTAGDYYLTDVDTAPNSNVIIDASSGPVRFYVEGEIYFAPANSITPSKPYDFQIYSNSTEDVRIQPNGDSSVFVYAPNATIELWPNGNALGAYWGKEVQLQPGGNVFVDTSLQDRWLSDDLTLHTRFESRAK